MKTIEDVTPGLTEYQEENLIREIYDNFPEASMSLRCVSWNYDKFEFRFIDDEDCKEYIVDFQMAIQGLRKFANAVRLGKLKGLGLPADFLEDTGNWDGFAFDAVNQMAIFGDVIYG